MRARVTFRSEIYLEGNDLFDIMKKFEKTKIYNENAVKDNGLAFCEVVSVENEDEELY